MQVLHIPGFTHPVKEHYLEDILLATKYSPEPNSDYTRKGAPKVRGWIIWIRSVIACVTDPIVPSDPWSVGSIQMYVGSRDPPHPSDPMLDLSDLGSKQLIDYVVCLTGRLGLSGLWTFGVALFDLMSDCGCWTDP